MLVRVERPINGPDGPIPVGSIQDASDWAHRSYFIRSGHIRGLNDEEMAERAVAPVVAKAPKAESGTKACPHGCGEYKRLDAHMRHKHTEELKS